MSTANKTNFSNPIFFRDIFMVAGRYIVVNGLDYDLDVYFIDEYEKAASILYIIFILLLVAIY